jgi:hypothetical protein
MGDVSATLTVRQLSDLRSEFDAAAARQDEAIGQLRRIGDQLARLVAGPGEPEPAGAGAEDAEPGSAAPARAGALSPARPAREQWADPSADPTSLCCAHTDEGVALRWHCAQPHGASFITWRRLAAPPGAALPPAERLAEVAETSYVDSALPAGACAASYMVRAMVKSRPSAGTTHATIAVAPPEPGHASAD